MRKADREEKRGARGGRRYGLSEVRGRVTSAGKVTAFKPSAPRAD